MIVNVMQHIRWTPSEIAMGRVMRAPDHTPAGGDGGAAPPPPPEKNEFDDAFAAAALEGTGDGAGNGSADGGGAGADATGGAAGEAAAGAAADQGGASPAGQGEGAAAPAAGAEGGATGSGDGATGADGGAAAAAAGADDKSGGAAPAAGAADTGAAPVTEEVLDRLAKAIAEHKPAEPKPAEGAADDQPPPIFSQDEVAQLDTFKKDWPTEHAAIELMQRQLGVGVIQHVFDQMAPIVREMRETVMALATRAHVGDLTQALGEYSDDEVDKVKEWIGTQPRYLQAGMTDVINAGTADDVADLVSRYREATGTAKQPAGELAAGQGASRGDTELSDAAKQAAAALAPVGSKRSVTPAVEDTSDFEGSFSKWAAEFQV